MLCWKIDRAHAHARVTHDDIQLSHAKHFVSNDFEKEIKLDSLWTLLALGGIHKKLCTYRPRIRS